MEIYASLSPREKRYQFIYLFGILLLAVIVFGTIIFRHFDFSFSRTDALEIQMLEQKKKFAEQESKVSQLLQISFKKISTLKPEMIQPFIENDIKNSINDVANSFESLDIYDTRKEGYLQIAKFYKMYFEDKKIASKKKENIDLFEQQFKECSVGLKDEEQQLQKQNEMPSQGNQ